MSFLTIQIHDPITGWNDAAELRITAAKDQHAAIEYDIDYATIFLQQRDFRALSVTFPVGLDRYYGPVPGYLVDLIPQGQVLERLLARSGISSASDYRAILSQVPLASPGNIRIKEAWELIEKERPSYRHKGFEMSEILRSNTNFLSYMQDHGAPIGGTSGAAGGAPKFLLREDNNGYFHADGYLDDRATKQAWLLKFPFTDSRNAKLLLRTEKYYYDILSDLGIKVGAPLQWYNDILFIPRFDRIRAQDGRLHYLGLESFYSAHGMNSFGRELSHEANIQLIFQTCSNPLENILEYLKRDFSNQALANTDNHGRNWSLIKKNGVIELSPQYDVTAMRFFEGDFIVPLTRWRPDHNDLSTRIKWICSYTNFKEQDFHNELKSFCAKLFQLEDLMNQHEVPPEIIALTKQDRELCIKNLENYIGAH